MNRIKIMVINGPNLNFLGIREKSIYGNFSYDYLTKYLSDKLKDIDFSFFQSNVEGELINKIQEAYTHNFDAIILNAGAYTHTSYAIYDAILSVKDKIPTVEVHISNINAREDFRKNSIISPACIGSISGFGLFSYVLAGQSIQNLREEE